MNKKTKRIILFSLLSLLFLPIFTFAHPGNTDASGCHTCRTNCAKWGLKNGEYHCHRQKELPQPKEPVKSKFSETGGKTVPAPEYKKERVNTVNTINSKNLNPEKDKKTDIGFDNSKKVEEKINNNKEIKSNQSWFSRFFSFIFNK